MEITDLFLYALLGIVLVRIGFRMVEVDPTEPVNALILKEVGTTTLT